MKDNKTTRLIAIAICALIPFAVLAIIPLGVLTDWVLGSGMAGIAALGVTHGLRDAASEVSVSKALSNGAGTVYSDGIDLGHGTSGDFLADVEFEIGAPALTTTLLPDTETLKYSIQHDTDPAFGTVATLLPDVLIQTGAGGAGAAAATVRVKLPAHVNRYIRLRAIKTGTGNATTVSATLQGRF